MASSVRPCVPVELRARSGPGVRHSARRQWCACSAAGITSRRRDKLPKGGFQEVFAVDLLASGKLTEQALTAADGRSLVPLEIKRPMGMVLAERRVLNTTTECFVDEVLPDSNALRAGVKVGDVLRLTTLVAAVRGKVDEIAYYSNPTSAKNRRALMVVDKQPFAKVMKAIASNAEPVDLMDGTARPFESICIVLERSSE
jgi:hypothetical protein